MGLGFRVWYPVAGDLRFKEQSQVRKLLSTKHSNPETPGPTASTTLKTVAASPFYIPKPVQNSYPELLELSQVRLPHAAAAQQVSGAGKLPSCTEMSQNGTSTGV